MDEQVKEKEYDRSAPIIEEDPTPASPAEEDPLANAFKEYAPEPKKNRWLITLLAVLMGLVAIFGLLWAFDVIKFAKDPEPAADLHDLPAAQSGEAVITNGMFAFDLENIYLSFQGNFGYYLSSIGLDTEKPLKEQTAYQREDSWFDYFVSRTKDDATWMLVLSRAAKDGGISLTEADNTSIASILSQTDFSTMHNGVTGEDGRAFLEMYYLALDQEEALMGDLSVTEEAINAAYEADPRPYQTCDYTYFVFSFGEGADFATEEEATVAAAPMINAATPEEFETAVVDRLIAAGQYTDREEAAAAYRQACVTSGADYREGDGYSDWLFDPATKVGDTKTLKEDGALVVFMLLTAPHRDESRTVDVRHILLGADNCGSEEAAAAKAEEILNTWRAGGATAESFGALAAQFTADGNGAQGGLYTGVTPGQMVPEFNDWCFDTTRQPGDSGIVKTQFGYHVMYFQAAHEAWRTALEETLREKAYQPVYDELCKRYPVTFFDENIQTLDL